MHIDDLGEPRSVEAVIKRALLPQMCIFIAVLVSTFLLLFIIGIRSKIFNNMSLISNVIGNHAEYLLNENNLYELNRQLRSIIETTNVYGVWVLRGGHTILVSRTDSGVESTAPTHTIDFDFENLSLLVLQRIAPHISGNIKTELAIGYSFPVVSYLLLLTAAFGLIGVSIFGFRFSASLASKAIRLPIVNYALQISRANSYKEMAVPSPIDGETREIRQLRKSMNVMIDALAEAEAQNLKLNTEARMGDIARQVAHDLRSPVSALQLVSTRIQDEMPNDELKEIVNISTARIKGIADDLLNRYKQPCKMSDEDSFDIVPIVRDLVREKVVELSGNNQHIKLSLRNNLSLQCKLKCSRDTFMRVISNLLNNSIEAVGEDGEIKIDLYCSGVSTVIAISDNGKGIPRSLLADVGRKGFSFGKDMGHGLGVYGAIQFMESLSGKFNIHSNEGIGTEVTLEFPT